jgi:uncharacterized phiE125 gp8 family phage protein
MAEPVTLDEMKRYLRVDSVEDNDLISSMILAARSFVEEFTHRALMSQTIQLVYDNVGASIEIPRPPLREIKRIETIDDNGTKTDVDSASYVVDASGTPGRVFLKSGRSWPSHRGCTSFLITAIVGYGENPADVPAAIREAIKKLVAEMYENRGAADVLLGTHPLTNQQQLIMAMVQPYRIYRL